MSPPRLGWAELGWEGWHGPTPECDQRETSRVRVATHRLNHVCSRHRPFVCPGAGRLPVVRAVQEEDLHTGWGVCARSVTRHTPLGEPWLGISVASPRPSKPISKAAHPKDESEVCIRDRLDSARQLWTSVPRNPITALTITLPSSSDEVWAGNLGCMKVLGVCCPAGPRPAFAPAEQGFPQRTHT